MVLEYTVILKVVVLAVLVSAMFYILRDLLRQQRALKTEGQVQALRLESFKQQAHYESLRALQSEEISLNTWSGVRKFRVDEIVPEAEDVCSFYLAPHDGKPLPGYNPGQYLTFQLDVPDQSRTVVRCYSLSDTPLEKDRYRVTIKRMGPPPNNLDAPPGVSSNYFHGNLKQGDILDCKAPRGNFYLEMAEHTPIVLIGGGIGITPMLSMLRSVALSGSKRETWLFYGARHMGELVQPEYIKALGEAHENIHIRYCLNEPAENEILGQDFEYHGFVSVELMKEVLPSLNYDFYVCGPPPMMAAITQDLSDAGVGDERIHYESFGPATVKKKTVIDESDASSEEYSIKFAKSGKELMWSRKHGTLLEFAEANDIQIDSGCRAGSCGTCTVAVRSGNVSYIEEIDAVPDEGSCLTCMAIPTETLVIDA